MNQKAKLWVHGRKDIFNRLSEIHKGDQWIWFHCASLGEFDQGKPMMDAVKREFPKYKLAVTFFSPSGYEIQKDNPIIDFVSYLPTDTKKNAQRFISNLNPDIVIFVKNEFWYHHLNELNQQNIPVFLISSLFRKDQIFFKSYGRWNRKMLSYFEKILVQNKVSKNLLQSIGIESKILGDIRFDRVLERVKIKSENKIVKKFKSNKPLLLAGSSWEEEEKLLKQYHTEYQGSFKLIIAPHDVSETHINQIKSKFPNAQCYSNMAEEDTDVLIIDSIGLLATIYQYGDAAFVGGGFKNALHNILEPAAFGVPVLFGNNHSKFHEANEMILEGGAKDVSDYHSLKEVLNTLHNDKAYQKKMGNAAKKYIQKYAGATVKTMKIITPYLRK